MHPMLALVQAQIAHLKAGGLGNGQIAQILGAVINGPILAAAVAATPTPIDDLILGLLKIMFPAPVAPAIAA